MFEQEIPEIAEGVIRINAISREPGYRSKVAVSSSDQRIDCVGACVGMRGNRIKNVTGELAGERIDIVRWSDDPMVLIPNALQPAEVEQVLLCDMIGRAIALVSEEHLSQAIGRYGQNVRLASKLCSWDIEIMTAPELERQIERAMEGFMEIEGMNESVAQQLVEQGYLSYDDLSVIEPDALMEMGNWSEDEVDAIIDQADTKAAEQEAVDEERKQQEKLDRERKATEELDRKEGVVTSPPSEMGHLTEEPATEEPAAGELAAGLPLDDSVPPAEPKPAEPKKEELDLGEQTDGNV